MYTFKKFILLEAELNLEWWNSKSANYKKRYLEKHPNSIYAQKVQSGEISVDDNSDTNNKDEQPVAKEKTDKKEAKLQAQIADLEKQVEVAREKHNKDFQKFREIVASGRSVTDEERDVLTKSWENLQFYENSLKRAQRGLLRRKQKQQLLERLTKNATQDHPDIAKYVDFHGMSEETEKIVVSAMKSNLDRYPFMKGSFSFIGSSKSPKFKEVSSEFLVKRYVDATDAKVKDADALLNQAKEYYQIRTNKSPDDASLGEILPIAKQNWPEYRLREALYIHNAVKEAGSTEQYVRNTYKAQIARSNRMIPRAYAIFSTDGSLNPEERKGMIYLSESRSDSDEMLKKDEDSKWHPVGCGTRKGILDHEFGHSIWYKLGLDKVSFGKDNYGNNIIKRTPIQKFIFEYMHANGQTKIKNDLSQYAATNASEFFAEAYSEYVNNPNPRPVAKKIGELLDQEIKERGL